MVDVFGGFVGFAFWTSSIRTFLFLCDRGLRGVSDLQGMHRAGGRPRLGGSEHPHCWQRRKMQLYLLTVTSVERGHPGTKLPASQVVESCGFS